MREKHSNTSTASGRNRSLRELTRRMRKILGRDDLDSETQRKAALRRLIHEQAAGLTRDEIEELVTDLRGHFPDRIFESVNSARGLASRTAELEEDVARLKEERDRYRQQVDHLGSHMARLIRAAETPAGQIRKTVSSPPVARPVTSQTQGALLEVATLLFSFALHQDETARTVEDTLGQDAAYDASRSLATLIPKLTAEEPPTPEDMAAIRQRLTALQILPGALLAGAQQSWKGGTGEILEHLHPKAARQSILGVPNYRAILKAVERGFEQFRNQFDSNVEHYYRGRFVRVYRDKMEDEL